jgi:hypothetical protein
LRPSLEDRRIAPKTAHLRGAGEAFVNCKSV